MNLSVKLEEKHLEILSRHKHFYDLFIKTGELMGFTMEVQNELLSVYQVVDPYYTYNNRCGACVGAFLSNVYKTFENELHS